MANKDVKVNTDAMRKSAYSYEEVIGTLDEVIHEVKYIFIPPEAFGRIPLSSRVNQAWKGCQDRIHGNLAGLKRAASLDRDALYTSATNFDQGDVESAKPFKALSVDIDSAVNNPVDLG